MAFEFKRKESVCKGVVRLGQRRIEKSIKTLQKPDRLKAIHDVRKGIKQIRALLRLVRCALKPSDYRRCSCKLQQAARLLSAARDSYVKLSALEGLTRYYKHELATQPIRDLKRTLRETCRKEQAALSKREMREVRQLLKQSLCLQASATFKSSGWSALGPGIKRTFQDGHRAYSLAQKTGKPEDFHEWRKRVKDLYFQMKLLCPIWPEQMNAATAELEQLGESLGDDHDLFMLAETVRGHPSKSDSSEGQKILESLIAHRQQDLRSRAQAIGARFYRDTPTALCKRLEKYWKNWRGNKRPVSA